MTKIIRRQLALLCCLLAACSATDQVPIYSLTELELAQLLSEQVQRQTQQLQLAGLPATVRAFELATDITQQGVQVMVQTDLLIGVGLLQLPVGVNLSMLAEPYYDTELHGVRLKNFRLLHAEIATAGHSARMKPVSNALQQQLASWLERQPVFVLDPTKTSQRALMAIPLKLTLEADRLVLSPAFSSQGQAQ